MENNTKSIIKPRVINSTQYEDGYTTAERSIINARRLDGIDEVVDFVGNVITPENLAFGDETLVSTQATRAEDIVSVEDERLESVKLDSETFDFYVEEQTQLDNTQDTAIANLQDKDNEIISDYFTPLELRVSTNETNIQDNENGIVDLEAEIDEITELDENQNSRLDAIESKDITQDNRIEVLEESIGSSVQDFAVVSATGTVGTTPTYIIFNITKDFTQAALNTITQESNATVIDVLANLTGQLTIEFSANTTTATNLNLGIYDYTTETLIETKTFPLAEGTEHKVGVIAGEFPIGRYAMKVNVDNDTVEITNSQILIINQALNALSEVYDNNVISTGTLGGTTTAEDIAILEGKKVDEISTLSDTGMITFENTIGTAKTSSPKFRYRMLEADATTTIQGVELGLDKPSGSTIPQARLRHFDAASNTVNTSYELLTNDAIITKSHLNEIANMLTPIGTIQLGSTAPTYGT
ncbi:MAG: hypothetical protein ACK5MR_12665 [Cumulibacter sp.]